MSAVTDFIAQLKGARVSPNIEPMRGDIDNFVLTLQELSAPVENNQAANTFYAGPINNPAAPPSFRPWSVNDPIGWGFAAGSIPFMTATGIAQNNGNLFWNNVTGNLGIGTSSPIRRLTVSNSGAEGLEIAPGNLVGDAAGAVTSVFINRNTSVRVDNIQDAATYQWQIVGVEKVRISAGGNVGIGTASPSILLDVAGPIGAKVYTGATLPSAGAKTGQLAFVSDATQTAAAGIGTIVAGGGANFVPVYSDGTNWRIV